MKTSLKIFLMLLGLSFISTGCYTIVWDPNQEFPNEESYNYNEEGEFYDYEAYGGYVDYYEAPWWVTPVVYITTTNENGDEVVTKVRNNGRDSNTEDFRNSGGRGNNDRTVDLSNTKTTISNTSNNSGTSNNSSSNNNSTTTTSTRESSSNNSSTTTRSSETSGNRNNSGSRNSGGRR